MRATCVICSDLFDEVRSIVVAPCGHVFHEDCIYQWVNRSSTCPECRQKVTFGTVKKLYFSFSATQICSSDNLQNQIHALEAKILAKDIALSDLRKEKDEIKKFVRVAEEKAAVNEQKVHSLNQELTTSRLVMKSLKKEAARADDLEAMNQNLLKRIEHLHNIETVVSGTQKDVDDIISSIGQGSDAVKQMATYFSLLKRELKSVSESKQQLFSQVSGLQKNISIQSVKIRKQAEEIKTLRDHLLALEKENFTLSKQASKAVPSKAPKAVVSYESPAPERMKRSPSSEDEVVVVTPVSERVTTKPLAKTMKLANNSRPSLSSANVHNGFEVKMSMLSSLKEKLRENEGSSIRLGYDGLGGHGKFIVRSTIKAAKLPTKKK